MSLSAKSERRALSDDEWDVVERTHYPAVCDIPAPELAEMRQLLRKFRDRARDRQHQQRREMRSKGEARGARPAREDAGSSMKLRALSGALRRVNRRLERSEGGTGEGQEASA